jgi:hypothetical protein
VRARARVGHRNRHRSEFVEAAQSLRQLPAPLSGREQSAKLANTIR